MPTPRRQTAARRLVKATGVVVLSAILLIGVHAMAQAEEKKLGGKPVLADPSSSDCGLDFFSQGGVVIDGVAYFTADHGCSKYLKLEGYPYVSTFDMQTFRRRRTYAFEDTYDSTPLVVQRRDGKWLIIAHEYKRKRSVARDRDTGEVVWISPDNEPGAYFFAHSYYVRGDGSKLILAGCQNGLHALDEDTGEEVWWVKTPGMGGATPCVDQEQGRIFYQNSGQILKIRAADGEVLKAAKVGHPNAVVSWNTMLANDDHGYYVVTYWFGFVDENGKKKMQWNSAIRVHDVDLNLVWEKTGLPCTKKSTLTYHDGKVVVGTGGHWAGKYEGTDWKFVPAYSVKTGELVWKCDLTNVDYQCIMNVPYAYGHFWAETWGTTSKLLKINAKTGTLEAEYDYGAGITSCAQPIVAQGRFLSGDLKRDGIVATEIAVNSKADWPGAFCDPQTNTYALPDDPDAQLVDMRELRAEATGAGSAVKAAAVVAADWQPSPRAIDLAKDARVYVTEGMVDKESQVSHLFDGDAATWWHGTQTPLTETPTSILVQFSKPEIIDAVIVVSQVFKGRLRLKDFEVYAKAGDGWANLASVTDSGAVVVRCEFAPVTTDGIRLRLRDTWRDDHAYPRVCELEIARAPDGAEGAAPEAGPVPGETTYERLMCDWAAGAKREYPGTTFDATKGYLHYARSFVDTMIEKGTDLYGDERSPMFVSILMVPTHKHPGHLLPCLDGQRRGDRANFGGNLHHDVRLLQAMDLLSEITGDGKYRDAADAYLKYFLDNCPRKETGLWPWGEHAHWDFVKDEPGHTTHEYLGGIPFSFWERAWKLNPDAVRGEAEGLLNHVVNLDTFTWNRHANIVQPLPTPRPEGLKPADFPRHGGFYVTLWTFVHAKTGEAKYLDWALRAIDHGWRLKQAPLNLLPFTETSNHANMESALSLSVSLVEAAALLPDGEAKERYLKVARTYLDAIARMPHKPAGGKFLTSCKLDAPPSEASGETKPWTAAYGGSFTADDAVLCSAVHRLTGDKRYLQFAKDAARFYATHEPPPANQVVRAHVYAAILNLFLDLHDQTKEPSHLEQAKRYAKLAIERLYHNGLFRGATGIDHYESQLMVSNLVYALVWLHVVETGADIAVEPNYFDR